jgi:hypothetical protein
MVTGFSRRTKIGLFSGLRRDHIGTACPFSKNFDGNDISAAALGNPNPINLFIHGQ